MIHRYGNMFICSLKDMCKSVHRCTLQSSSKLATTQVMGMNKMPVYGTIWNMEQKPWDTKEYILYDSINIKFKLRLN